MRPVRCHRPGSPGPAETRVANSVAPLAAEPGRKGRGEAPSGPRSSAKTRCQASAERQAVTELPKRLLTVTPLESGRESPPTILSELIVCSLGPFRSSDSTTERPDTQRQSQPDSSPGLVPERQLGGIVLAGETRALPRGFRITFSPVPGATEATVANVARRRGWPPGGPMKLNVSTANGDLRIAGIAEDALPAGTYEFGLRVGGLKLKRASGRRISMGITRSLPAQTYGDCTGSLRVNPSNSPSSLAMRSDSETSRSVTR